MTLSDSSGGNHHRSPIRSVPTVFIVITSKNAVPQQLTLCTGKLERHEVFPCQNVRSDFSTAVPTNSPSSIKIAAPCYSWTQHCGLHTATSPPTYSCHCTSIYAEVSPTIEELIDRIKMWNLSRVTFNNLQQSRRLSYAIPSTIFSLQNDSSFMRRFCSLDSHESGGLIPPELLRNKIVLRPDSDIGKYADLVTRVTNFHCEDKGLMVLAGDVFDSPIRKDIVQRVVRWQLAKRQQGTHSTKTISEVSGTGRKAYPQKGTGRARHGSLRAPQFRHGATMHGPKPRSHAFKLQKKVRRLGLKIALSARTAEGKLIVFEDLEVPSHKTKNIVNYLAQLENTRKVLLVDGGPIDDKLKLATRNLQYVNVLPSIGLNVYSILLHDTLVMTRDAVSCIVERMHTPINR
ncbi:50S ribosomal protein L4-like isoform X2 [Zingiber officinale]|uniref:50S ribosomal protein L4-like isoform X2 n=1 Tax=Zingiber officinale TaxID=94328 RepID=UPI001C4D09CC|nr:50S ribosomal protein L4-like isoform X2 [Zingiber officinale]